MRALRAARGLHTLQPLSIGSPVRLHVEDHGDGIPVVLVHGWPDSSQLWRRVTPALNEAGYRTLAPDLRGFGRSPRPAEVEAYAGDLLVADVLQAMDEAGVARAHLVGHGWGAFVAWTIATRRPERVRRLAVLGIAHPGTAQVLDLAEYERRWYQYFFLFEEAAEAALAHDGWRLFREFVRDSEDAGRNVADLSRPGALTASLNVFRANMRPQPPGPMPEYPPVEAPVLAVWCTGDAEKGLPESRLLDSRRFVRGEWRYHRLEAGHWIPLEDASTLTALLLDWFGRGD